MSQEDSITNEREEVQSCFFMLKRNHSSVSFFWKQAKRSKTVSQSPFSAEGKRKQESSSVTTGKALTLPEAPSTPNLFTYTLCFNDGYKYPASVPSSCLIRRLHIEESQYVTNLRSCCKLCLCFFQWNLQNEIQIWAFREKQNKQTKKKTVKLYQDTVACVHAEKKICFTKKARVNPNIYKFTFPFNLD